MMNEYRQTQQYKQKLTIGNVAEKFLASLLEDRFGMTCHFPKIDDAFSPFDFTAIGKRETKTIEVKFDDCAINHAEKRSNNQVNLFIEFFNPIEMYASKISISKADLLAYILNEKNICYFIDQKKLKQFIIDKYKNNEKVYIGTNNTESCGLGFLLNVEELKQKRLITKEWTLTWD